MLNTSQTLALNHIRSHAKSRQAKAQAMIEHILQMSNIEPRRFQQAIEAIKSNAPVALHFHPDRIASQNLTVVDQLLQDGRYKSQFETHISNGKVSPEQGGPRDNWENALFGDAYTQNGFNPVERPKYGALHLMNHSDGPCPRFGSCYFLLNPEVSQRATFTYRDSHTSPQERGTLDCFDDILVNLLIDAFELDFALGCHGMRPAQLVDSLINRFEQSRCSFDAHYPINTMPLGRNLDHYIEAQIHGDISLTHDVMALVADPSFKGTEIGQTLLRLCQQYNIELMWHQGYALNPDNVPDDFRGNTMPALANLVSQFQQQQNQQAGETKLGGTHFITASTIGAAAANLIHQPDNWHTFHSQEEGLQQLKLLWHVLVKFG
ncbi:DUF3626 domain-containing protein [Photobacterium sanctipauli]|uniref:DUF3626 domain-containing protein n=1 Tax=Photobacterium sanctipauli TaxID=1342794 RepID=A0A2T3NWD7_9GAMM|nr:DUF3626 domain-containing protein [Photobacterium sanctipauli]PSW20551.1 DUF3626 domain-containing protein [Photobacterium sanctipauli]